jgi:hypothetical protein
MAGGGLITKWLAAAEYGSGASKNEGQKEVKYISRCQITRKRLLLDTKIFIRVKNF